MRSAIFSCCYNILQRQSVLAEHTGEGLSVSWHQVRSSGYACASASLARCSCRALQMQMHSDNVCMAPHKHVPVVVQRHMYIYALHEVHLLRCAGVGAESATWRRGAQGRPHAGQPLCNKCGVWEFRHPDSPPRDLIDEVSTSATCCTSRCCCCCGDVSHDQPL